MRGGIVLYVAGRGDRQDLGKGACRREREKIRRLEEQKGRRQE